jgi:hypothetical protein
VSQLTTPTHRVFQMSLVRSVVANIATERMLSSAGSSQAGPMASGLGQRARPSIGLPRARSSRCPPVPNVSSMLLALSLRIARERRAPRAAQAVPSASRFCGLARAANLRHATTRPDSGGCTDSHRRLVEDDHVAQETRGGSCRSRARCTPAAAALVALPVLPECQGLSPAS